MTQGAQGLSSPGPLALLRLGFGEGVRAERCSAPTFTPAPFLQLHQCTHSPPHYPLPWALGQHH